ncbi:MAG: aldo/keto reductase [Dehalococcoidia bacterium]|nr:MAG: aldo/keto reductase [Dehalococcoidia bacterium]
MPATGLPTRTLGRTGLEVTTLGYGAMSLDSRFGRTVSQDEANTVLNALLDAGVNFIDTSPDYGPSEEMVGKAVAGRRNEYVLASKCGCPVAVEPGQQGHVYTPANITAAIEQSLRRLQTDHLDIVQFHGSPSRAALEEHRAIRALQAAQQAGKVRFIGMSGTIPNLADQIALGVFDVFQIPYSALQREHETLISAAHAAGAGTVIRGGVARGAPSEEKAWDIRRLPEVPDERPRTLWEQASLDDLLGGMTRMEFMLRFTLSHPDLDTTIVGTANPDHLRQNLDAARKGPLPADVMAEAKRRLDAASK